jgi:hypothetical protein
MEVSMKSIAKLLTVAALAAITAVPAFAAPVCLQNRQIDHTSVPDAHTILFHMRNGVVWRNTLHGACPGLLFNGYVMNFRGGMDEVCGNMESLRVLKSNEVCLLGEFTREAPHA